MNFLKQIFTPQFINIALTKTLPVIIANKLIFFCIYKYTKNPCVVDVGYTVGHFAAGLTYAFYLGSLSTFDTKIKLVILGFWCIRLAGFLTKYRAMRGYHDPRYEDIFKKYPPGSFGRDTAVFAQFLFQGLIVLVTSSPLYWMLKNVQPWNLQALKGVGSLNFIGLGLSVIAIILEGIADQQLQNYKDNKDQYKQGHIFEEGLWQKSRHPNLFFELLTWGSFALSGIKSIQDIGAFIGPFTLYLVMDKLTVPITERYLKKSRGDQYTQFLKRTNKFWPF